MQMNKIYTEEEAAIIKSYFINGENIIPKIKNNCDFPAVGYIVSENGILAQLESLFLSRSENQIGGFILHQSKYINANNFSIEKMPVLFTKENIK